MSYNWTEICPETVGCKGQIQWFCMFKLNFWGENMSYKVLKIPTHYQKVH